MWGMFQLGALSLEEQLHEVDRRAPQRDQFSGLNHDTQGKRAMRDGEQSQYSDSNNSEEECDQTSPRGVKTLAAVRGEELLSDLMQADLDQLYFDRVHATVPIIHKYHYYVWSRNPGLKHSQVCLRNAMWILAMSHSSQFENVREAIYNETRQKLEENDLSENNMNVVQIEQVQAWILITSYEFLRSSYQRAWFSAGRVFRLVQLLRLHELDNHSELLQMLSASSSQEEEIGREERRRAFWVAYCLDRFISVQNGLPLTLNEEVICTRLPCLESEFETGKIMRVSSLSEAIAACNVQTPLSPLAECAILVTLYGRALSHSHVSTVEQYYGNTTQDFWFRHEWIDFKLREKADTFALKYPTTTIFAEPMLLMSFMILQATTLYLYKIMESMSVDDSCGEKVLEYQIQAITAAKKIANLTKEHARIGYFNGHVFIPAAIYLGIERLMIQRDAHMLDMQFLEESSIGEGLDGCLEILRKIQSVNNLAKYYLNLLDSGQLGDSRPLQP
ncbi:hypothetical protein V501_00654 [Pseudogymnoascus sp. VKM F-4519 (FW-2642)]|nr:hypothetical protein V501_00654 [Pseudogymnoascus sp. VKM F-4519 (FW-2642)]